MKVKSEFKFILPDESGGSEKIRGVMKLIKVKDLMEVYRDMRVRENPSLYYIVLLKRVITKMGSEKMVSNKTIENLSSQNFAFLVDFMNEINHQILTTFPVRCSGCNNLYTGGINIMGEL